MAEALKYDTGKARMDLLDPQALEELANVLGYGAKKYAAHNWRKGMDWSRMVAAALRHINAFNAGQDRDPETGLLHTAHAMCCLMFLTNYAITATGNDDRYVEEQPIFYLGDGKTITGYDHADIS